MTPEEKAKVREAVRKKKQSDLTVFDRAAKGHGQGEAGSKAPEQSDAAGKAGTPDQKQFAK